MQGQASKGEPNVAPEKPAIPVQFTGDALEYFGIWIVNFLLSVVTLGVYSAWAKVRNKKYLLRNVTIDGRAFDYHARGWDILVGRFVAIAMIVAWSLLVLIPDPDIVVFVSGFLPLAMIPWLINHSLRFNAAMTSWSNVRFRFDGSYFKTLAVFLLLPLLASLTLFLAVPFVIRGQIRYLIGELRLGGVRFGFESGVGPFYAASVLTVLWAFGVLLMSALFAAIIWNFRCLHPCPATGGPFDEAGAWVIEGVFIGLFVVLFTSFTIFYSCIRNALYAGISLKGGHQFESRASTTKLICISIGNAILIVVSLGMLLPWAQIRLVRYLCAHTWIRPAGSLDDFVSQKDRRPTALGDAIMEIVGIDV